jgi:LPS-assembly protein
MHHMRFTLLWLMFFRLGLILMIVVMHGVANAAQNPVILDADQFTYDNQKTIVQATGNVKITQLNQTLSADKIIYNVNDDFAYAEGNVVLEDGNGDTHYAETLELNDQMREGVVQGIFSVLEDESRLWAAKAVRESPEKHVLKDARYTPCKACDSDPDKTPPWALRASEVTHDKEEARISYDNVRFEAWGVPVAYAPYFSHPDGTVTQKSGFLTPELGFGSDDGFHFMMPYYWAISPSMDATIGVKAFSKSAPQLNLELRKRYENAAYTVQTSGIYSDRTDSVNGNDVTIDEELRGHIEADALWNINNKWRAGADVYLASDEQYLDQYDIDDEDVLENRLYVERFDKRDYASVQLLAFQDLRLDEEVDQPNALPLANMNFMGAPNSALGGRFKWDTSFLSLYREGNEQDMSRASSEIAWQRQDILALGLVTETSLAVRGDAYYTTDRDIAKTRANEDGNQFDDRVIPTAHVEMAYPLQKQLSASQIRIKPRISLTARPDIDNDSDIPNEDSQDAQIDYLNLFEADRFPGLDRVEDRSRVNYGVEAGYYTDEGDEFTAGLGQSFRFDDEDNPFLNGSGFEQQSSDIVGQVGASFDDHRHNMNYRFQIDGRHMNAERHEFYGGTKINRTTLSAIYLYEKGSAGTEFTESREQVQASARYSINDNWGINASALYDLGEDEGLRQSIAGVSYDDDCFGITAEFQRDLQRDATGSSDTSVLLRFRLKNLGEFETTAYDGGSDSDETDIDESLTTP